ncbi:MAG TPA: glycine dehydrogenase, partial [Thermomicrobiales bacterium]|nr:glycine dehydrogenase [Thermomicrobiales bacterium]
MVDPTMTFNPHTDEDRVAMLEAIGVERVEDLFADIPAAIRFPNLALPPQLSEPEAAARLAELAERNVAPKNGNVFLGAWSYHHYVPAAVGQIISRGEFYTA